MSAISAFFDLLFPPHCAFCNCVGVHGVCPACERGLPRMREPLRKSAGFGLCAVPLRYEGLAREGILRFKFQGASGAAMGMGRILGECAEKQLSGCFDTVTWVPVSDKRKSLRGYDQAYLLAREAAKEWDMRPIRLLRKAWDNPPQSTLDEAQRRDNVMGIYQPVNIERIKNARILLVDDIVTTGATLTECARVLKLAGADGVVCACLASTEPPKEQPKETPKAAEAQAPAEAPAEAPAAPPAQ